ncbi:oxygenase MpaB family protein [Streptomyces sp. YIM 98790]|uniref:oxygenase MpaB family protein n=1 Tax=Streptomyces sp. YIM 98790 TaxID=2689077 RepID=UPI001FB69322|nr:oxygenase MpaB family protein [Streptomyces sp. YIM 98790]
MGTTEREADAAAAGVPPAGGMLWECTGELRMVLSLPAALTLQVAHPAVGAGVDAHSVFRTDPWGRAERSLRSVQLWVYGGEQAVAEGRRVRLLHREIGGTDARGRPYHAWEPRLYGWVHATGFPVMRHAWRIAGQRPFTAEEEARLYAEWRGVGRLLGLRERDIPADPESFRPYWRAMLEEVEATVVVRELLDVHRRVPPPDRGPWPVRALLRALWPVLWPPLARGHRFLVVGFMPPEAREALGLPWSARQERRLRRLGRLLAAVVPRLPERLRYLPLAARARRDLRAGRARRPDQRREPAR